MTQQKPIEKLNIPPNYAWLLKEPGPRILIEMLKIYDVVETPGAANNPIIMGWAKEIGRFAGADYLADSTPWCGLGLGVAALRAGYDPPEICIRASSWDNWGTPVEGGPLLGDVLRFEREGGGHVGLYVGEDRQGFFHVLGANQNDRVNVIRIAKTRLKAARRTPWQVGQPRNVRRVFLEPKGVISKNEG